MQTRAHTTLTALSLSSRCVAITALTAIAACQPAATGQSATANSSRAIAANARAPVTSSPAGESPHPHATGERTGPEAKLHSPEPSAETTLTAQRSTTPPTPAASRRPCRVAAIGDSLTDSRSGGGKYLSYLQERCPLSSFSNLGVGGEMVNQMRRRFLDDLKRARTSDEGETAPGFTHVIVFGGVNDLYSDLTAQRSVDKITRDLSFMYQRASETGAQVVAITVAPWGGFRRYFNEQRSKTTLELNAWIEAQTDNAARWVIDAYGLLSCGDEERLCPRYATPFKDGIHFGPEGHRVLGEALYERVFHDCS